MNGFKRLAIGSLAIALIISVVMLKGYVKPLLFSNSTSRNYQITPSATFSTSGTEKFHVTFNHTDKQEVKNSVINLESRAKLGQVDDSPFTAGKSTLTQVKQKWGQPDNQVVAEKGSYATYKSKKLAFEYNQNGTIFDVRSYSKKVQNLSQSTIQTVLGKPKLTSKPTSQQLNEVYQVNPNYQLEFIIDTDSSKVDHISVFNASAVQSQPNQQKSIDSQIVPIRGIIEGFYGTPWTNEERITIFKFMENEKLNTYVYAPKDDPYQRSDWRSPYPLAKLTQMKTLVTGAKLNHIKFVYSISPGMTGTTKKAVGKSMSYSSSSDQQALEKKIDQLRSIGVHIFMLSFDDIDTRLKPADRRIYGANYPKAQIELANKILLDEQAKDPGFKLWLAPTTYYGLVDNPYWKTIRSTLNGTIKVIWTGKWVLNKTITHTQVQTITRLLGRKPILWDNYPVNDYTYVQNNKPQLMMGPLQGRSPSLTTNISGYLSNPMIQPDASKLTLETISAYLQDPKGYQSKIAWEKAINHMPGITNPSLFRIFAEFNSSSILNPLGYSPLKTMIGSYQKAKTRSQKQAAEKTLEKEFLTIEKLPSTLPQTITDKALLCEIQPWLTKIGEEGQGGLDALAYINHPNQTNKQQLYNQLKRVNSSTYTIGETIPAFIEWAENQQ